jgi:hypothetical protein
MEVLWSTPLSSPPTQPDYLKSEHHNRRNPDTTDESASKNCEKYTMRRETDKWQAHGKLQRFTWRNAVLCAHITARARACVCVCVSGNLYLHHHKIHPKGSMYIGRVITVKIRVC